MSNNDKTALEKHGGLLGIIGICLFLLPKVLSAGSSTTLYLTLAGLSVLIIGCLLLAVAHLRREEPRNKVIGAAILVVILVNCVLVYRAFFASGLMTSF